MLGTMLETLVKIMLGLMALLFLEIIIAGTLLGVLMDRILGGG